jgi:GTPase SAR1 family protein
MPEPPDRDDARRIVVVGRCASGKTTLVERLKALGYEAKGVAQEHSIVRDLWLRAGPDVLVAVDVDLVTVRQRRSPTWPADVYEKQTARLREAVAAADIVIDTAMHDEDDVVRIVVEWMERTRDA